MDNSDGHANPIVYWGQHSASNHLTNKRTRGGYGKSQKPSDKDIFIFTYHGGWKHTKEIIEDADAEAIANLVDMSKKYYAWCTKYNKITHSATQSHYANSLSHAKLCSGELEEKYHAYMQDLYYDDEDKIVKVQQGLLESMWMEIVTFICILKISGMITHLR